jgi:aconitase B
VRAIELARAVKSQDATGEAVQDELHELIGENLANQVLQSVAQVEAAVADDSAYLF